MREGVSVRSWPQDKSLNETAIRKLLAKERLTPYTWSNGPGDVYSPHKHPYTKVIYVLSGSITFGLPDFDEKIPLQKGDRLNLAAGVVHDAVVGNQGVICLEAHH